MKKYNKDFAYSYAIGVYPTLELLKYKPDEILQVYISSNTVKSSGVEKVKEICHEMHIKIEVNDGAVNNLSGVENAHCTAVFKKYTSGIEMDANHVVLVAPNDLGNLGTIIRTMIGFDCQNLAIIKPGVEIFDPKVVRASMGAVFQINFQYFGTFEDYQKAFSNQNLYPFLTSSSNDLQAISYKLPFSLIFGNESSGLGEKFKNIGTSVRIDHSNKIDSLSLPVSVGLGLYFPKK